MTINSKNNQLGFSVTYLLILALALYFSRGLTALHSPYLLVLTLAALGLTLNFVILLVFGKKAGANFQKDLPPFLIFMLLQGGLGYAVARFAFNLPHLPSLAFPAGCVATLLTWIALRLDYPNTITSLKVVGLLAFGVAIALRLGGIFGGLAFGLAALNGFYLGYVLLKEKVARQDFWVYSLWALGLLVVGRAAIQYYLWESNYADLGVVITHPYTFVGLFAGILTPIAIWMLEKEGQVPRLLLIILLGIFFPLVGGIFIHVRPMAGYLLGLVVSAFLVGILFLPSYAVHLVTYLSLASTCFGLPLFTKFSNLSRTVRLEILAGVLVIMAILFFAVRPWDKRKQAS